MLTRHPPHRGIRYMWPGRQNQEVAQEKPAAAQRETQSPGLGLSPAPTPGPRGVQVPGHVSFSGEKTRRPPLPRPCTQRPCTRHPPERRVVLLAIASLLQEAPGTTVCRLPPRRPPRGNPRPQHTSPAEEPSVSPPGALWGSHFPRAPMRLRQDRPHGAWARVRSLEVL